VNTGELDSRALCCTLALSFPSMAVGMGRQLSDQQRLSREVCVDWKCTPLQGVGWEEKNPNEKFQCNT
jgi:CxxC motif-containing protein (DUF1111 family)